MSDLIQSGFDYGDLTAEKVLECETAFQTACAIENQATRMIGEQFAKVKDNLKHLRNGNGWREWCDKKLNISHTQAQNYINEFENGEFVKQFYKFGKTARWLLVAPNTPQEVRDRADALAEAGEDVSVKTIKQLKADVEAERQARLVAEQRNVEWQEQNKADRDKLRQAERQIDLLKSAEKPEPVIVEKEVIPDDYESAKQQASELQAQTESLKSQIQSLQKQQDKIISDQVKSKLQGYQSELDKLEADKAMIEDIVARKKAYLDSLSSEVKRIETHREVINGARLELINLAAFLNDMEPMNDPDTINRWLALADMHHDAVNAIHQVFGDHRHKIEKVACFNR